MPSGSAPRSHRLSSVSLLVVGVLLGVLGTHPLFFCLITILVLVGITRCATDGILRRNLSIALLLSAVIVVILYVGSTAQYGTAIFRGSNSHTIYASRMAGEPFAALFPPPDRDFYYPFLAVVYTMGAFGRIVPILVNLLSLPLLVVYTYRLAALGFGRRYARTATTLLVFFPTVYLHTYRTAPDLLNIALVMVALYYMTQLRSLSDRRVIIKLTLTMVVTAMIRDQVAALLILSFVGTILFRQFWDDFTVRNVRRTVVQVVSGLSTFVVFVYAIDFWGARTQSFSTIVTRILTTQVPDGSAAGLSTIIFGAPVPMRLILGFFPLVITPYPPWVRVWESSSMTFYAVAGVAFFLLAPFAVAGILETIRERRKNALSLLTYTVMVACVLALVYGGFVTKFRLLLVPPALIFASYGMSWQSKYWVVTLAFYLSYPVITVVYLVLKGGV